MGSPAALVRLMASKNERRRGWIAIACRLVSAGDAGVQVQATCELRAGQVLFKVCAHLMTAGCCGSGCAGGWRAGRHAARPTASQEAPLAVSTVCADALPAHCHRCLEVLHNVSIVKRTACDR